MKFKYTKKYRITHFILFSVWIILGVVTIIFESSDRWSKYFYLIMGLFYGGITFMSYKNQYVELTEEYIQISPPVGRKVALKDIKSIKYFAGDYIIKTDSKEITLNTQIMDPESRVLLEQEFDKWPVEWLGRKPKAA